MNYIVTKLVLRRIFDNPTRREKELNQAKTKFSVIWHMGISKEGNVRLDGPLCNFNIEITSDQKEKDKYVQPSNSTEKNQIVVACFTLRVLQNQCKF